MIPSNVMLRIPGKRADIIVVSSMASGLGTYYVAYEFSKSKDQWRFHLDRDCSRYETFKLNSAKATARRLHKAQNVSV
jgi:hypothetical protein